MSEKVHNPDQQLQAEFNRWAEAGEGEKMENHHLDITNKTLRLMDLKKTDRVLDLGCGSGWASRLLAKDAREVTGVDVSDEMVKQATESSKNYPNVKFLWGSAQKIPCGDNSFDKMLSVESFYYYADQEAALDEIFRVMVPGGRIFILINLYKDNEYSLQWVHLLKVPVHVRSAAEYVAMFEKHGFRDAAWKQIPDDTPTPDDYKTKSFRSLDDLKAFKRVGALLLMGTKG